MPLKGIIDSLDEVPEAHRPLYKKREADGKFLLDTDLHEQLGAVLRNKEEILREKREQQEIASKFKDLDPEKSRAALARVAKLDQEEAERKGEWDKLKSQMVEDHTKQLQEKDKEIAKLRNGVQSLAINAEVSRLMASDPELKGSPKMVMPHVSANVRVKETPDGGFIAEVLKDGSPRVVGTDAHPMALRDYLLELKGDPELGRAFDGTGSTGSGAPNAGAGGAGGAVTIQSRSKASVAEKVAFIAKHGQAAFEALPD